MDKAKKGNKSKNASVEKNLKNAKKEKTDSRASSKDKRDSKKDKDKEDKAPRIPSGYLLFTKDERPNVVKDNPDMKAKEIMTELGKRWRELSDGEKNKYNAKSADLKKDAGKDVGKRASSKPKKEEKKDDPKKKKKGGKTAEEDSDSDE